MVGWCDIDKIRSLPILEEKGDIGLKRRLIAFGREVIMRLAFYQIARQFALRQQCVSGNVLALDVYRIEKRNEHSDFIGLLGLFTARYGQGTDFFWV